MRSKVYQGQSFLDKVIEQTGSIENAFEMAFVANVSITDNLEAYSDVVVSAITNPSVVSFFNEFNRPATRLTTEQSELLETIGIGTSSIEINFIVN